MKICSSLIKQTLSTSNIEVNSNDNDDVSTDEEEIDRKLHVLIKRLESKLDNPDKSVSQKQSVKKGKVLILFGFI